MNRKKIKALLLVLLIAMLTVPVQAFAATSKSVTVKIGDVHGEAGQVITVPVSVSAPVTDIAAYGLELNYDNTSLEVKEIHQVDDNQEFQSNFSNKDGYLRAAWADATGGDDALKNAATLFTVDFLIKENPVYGKKSINVPIYDAAALSFTDSNNNNVSATVENGSFTINKSSNSKLSSLLASDGTWNETFSPEGKFYTVAVKSTVNSLNFVPTAQNEYAHITINDKKVTSGTLSHGFSLKEGSNSFTIKVTAEDGSASTYTVKVNKEKEAVEEKPDTNTEIVTVDIQSGNDAVVSKTTIYRTTDEFGIKSDKVTLTKDVVKELLASAELQDSNTAKIIIPDTQDEISETYFSIPKDALKLLSEGNINIQLVMNNAQIVLPKESLKDVKDDLYFRFVPVKTETEKNEVKNRALNSITSFSEYENVQVLGRPMEIQTNMENSKVKLILPVESDVIDTIKAKNSGIENLPIFIEHDDGTKEVIDASFTNYHMDGFTGLAFEINKFSTFTPLYLSGAVTNNTDQEAVSGKDAKDSKGTEASSSADTTVSTDEQGTGTNLKKLPKTGDDSYIDMILNISIVAIAAILVFLFVSKKRRLKKQ
ncbi:cohesin domain-containing protein [Niallia taxi]|nr:cadherin-like beta sandwich domain-containing protein [Niallia taxi]MDE5054962.1 cohesin domain-containing protein [Niallia taxi]